MGDKKNEDFIKKNNSPMNDNKNFKGGSGNNNNNPNKNKNNKLYRFILISLCVTLVLNYMLQSQQRATSKIIHYSEFLSMVKNNKVESVEFKGEFLVVTEVAQMVVDNDKEANSENLDKNNNLIANPFLEKDTGIINEEKNVVTYNVVSLPYNELINVLEEYNVEYWGMSVSPLAKFITNWVLPFLLFYGMIILLTTIMSKKMGGMGGVGKSKAKFYKEDRTGVLFKDVAGQKEAKESLDEIVDYLHHPDKYKKIGANQPKGALLVGPPGTGKTLLAKAVAGEANVSFLSLVGSDFVEMYVGVGASRVRDLFKTAKENAPCIIFIDEIDAIGKKRDTQFGSNDEREQTLNQLLSEMDGFDSEKAIVVLAATNRPEVLDNALLRPGRFDRRVIVEKPDLKDRIAILEVHSKKVQVCDTVDFHKVALSTVGTAGADLANIVNEAALHAVRCKRDKVMQEDFMEAVETIIAGKEKKDRIMGPKEKKIVAYHEIGHALTAVLQEDTDPIQKITIIPRTKGSLGYTMQVPKEEKFLQSDKDIMQEVVTLLGGRCAENLIFKQSTTGAHNDIERSTVLIRSMITEYGMSKKFGMVQLESRTGSYLGSGKNMNCSEETKTLVDIEVRNIINDCYNVSFKLLEDNMELLNELTNFLIEKENISGDEFMEIFRRYYPKNTDSKNDDVENINNNN